MEGERWGGSETAVTSDEPLRSVEGALGSVGSRGLEGRAAGVNGWIGTNLPRPVVQYLFGSISESLHGGVVVPPTPGDPAGCLALECVRQRLTGVGSLGCWRWGAPIKVDRLWSGGWVTGPIRLPGLPSASSPPCTCLRERVSHLLARVPRSFLSSIMAVWGVVAV